MFFLIVANQFFLYGWLS